MIQDEDADPLGIPHNRTHLDRRIVRVADDDAEYWAEPIGQILPGTVQVQEIISYREDRQQRWRITLSAAAGETHGLAVMDAQVTFITTDKALVRQLRLRKLRFCLDLLQLQRTGLEEGTLTISAEDDGEEDLSGAAEGSP